MMTNTESEYRDLAKTLGLELSICNRRYFLYGTKGDYEIVVYTSNVRNPYRFTVAVAVVLDGKTIEPQQLKEFVMANESVLSLRQQENRFVMKMNMKNYSWAAEKMGDCLNELAAFLADKGCVPCCQLCRQRKETTAYLVVEEPVFACQECMEKAIGDKESSESAVLQEQRKEERILTGIFGAFLGSVLGVICIIFSFQMGEIGMLSGIIMGICTIKGYELFAGRSTKRGIVISTILIIIMTYIGHRLMLSYRIKAESGFDGNVMEIFILVPQMFDGLFGFIAYWGSLGMLYFFTLGASLPIINIMAKNKQEKERVFRIDSGVEVAPMETTAE